MILMGQEPEYLHAHSKKFPNDTTQTPQDINYFSQKFCRWAFRMTFILWSRVFLSIYPSRVFQIKVSEHVTNKMLFAPPLELLPQNTNTILLWFVTFFLFTHIFNTKTIKKSLVMGWQMLGKWSNLGNDI